MTAPRIAVLMAATGLTLAACGSGSDSAPPVTEPPVVTNAPAADAAEPADDFSEADTEAEPPVASAIDDTTEPEAVSDPPPTEPADEPADETAAEAPPATEAPVEVPAEPVLGGRSLAADVQPQAQFESNPFPDLVVNDVGKGTQVNVANILPSDRPVLLWAWAPH